MSDADILALEYRLTIAAKRAEGCDECVDYLLRRAPVLIPAVLERAQAEGTDPQDKFAAFVRGLHAHHGDPPDAGRRLAGRVAALMAMVHDATDPTITTPSESPRVRGESRKP